MPWLPSRRSFLFSTGMAGLGSLLGGHAAGQGGDSPSTDQLPGELSADWSTTANISDEYSFGWTPDLPDLMSETLPEMNFELGQALPRKIDLSGYLGPAYSQGRIGSCTANAVAAAIQYARRQSNRPDDFIPSRLFLYYFARSYGGTTQTDSGSAIRNAIQVAKALGACPESMWPYDDTPADRRTRVFPPGAKAAAKPSDNAITDARQYVTISESPIRRMSEQNIKGALAGGFPIIFGFTVYENLFSNGVPVVKLDVPGPGARPMGQGHAVLAVGYDDDMDNGRFKIRNSWGPHKQDRGHFYMSYEYLTNPNLCSNLWVIYETAAMGAYFERLLGGNGTRNAILPTR